MGNDALMSSMNIRKPIAATFAVLVLASTYLGLSTQKLPQYGQSDKGLHLITFFLLTLSFYWIFELPRRRCIHLTLIACTAGLGIGSEVVQGLLPNGRDFDPYDILANVVGSALSLSLCSWYHRRMLERKRKNKHYDIIPGDELPEDGGERDVELGDVGVGAQETGLVREEASSGTASTVDITRELDEWDENAEDWEEEGAEGAKVAAGVSGDEDDMKKRTD